MFIDAFRIMGRNENFSYHGKKALFEYLEQYEEDTGEEIEFDVIALCCDFSEYPSALECATEYGYEADKDATDEEKEEAALEWLRDRTTVIEAEGHDYSNGITNAPRVSSVIVQQF